MVLGRNIPQFAFLNVLLGSEAVLIPEDRLRQRLLAAELPEGFLKNQSLETFYQKIAIPTLVTIEYDRPAGIIDDRRQQSVAQGMFTVIENLSDHECAAEK